MKPAEALHIRAEMARAALLSHQLPDVPSADDWQAVCRFLRHLESYCLGAERDVMREGGMIPLDIAPRMRP